MAQSALATLRARPPADAATWERVNYRGTRVSLLGGPASAMAASAAAAFAPGLSARARLAAIAAGAGAGALGLYDDLAGSSHARGFAGHLAALRRGTVTTGLVKIAGIGAAGLVAGSLAGGRGRSSLRDQLVSGAVIASSANLVNLLDLRPGRAAKAVVLAGTPLSLMRGPGGAIAAAATGAATGIMREDLAEEVMLGDAGANALGALIGLAAVLGTGRRTRIALLAGLVALNASSERVSFSSVIEGNEWLRRLDSAGRRP